MSIAIVDAYYDISHRLWAESWKKHSRHDIDIYSLPPAHWKWQMMGGTIALSQMINKAKKSYDLIIVTDMVNLPTFRSLLSAAHREVPIYIYFHENQITYPWSPTDQDVKLERDHHYGFINYTSALAADQVFFNSTYHKDSFIEALPAFIRQFPSSGLSSTIEDVIRKSSVLPIGLELPKASRVKSEKPTFIWNHRWEYDKNPEGFFNALFQLKERGHLFDLIVVGKKYAHSPVIFQVAKERLAEEIIHFGYAEDRTRYLELISKANILLVTGYQDFFGISVVEAIAAGCYPLLPQRLAYPEHIPQDKIEDHVYNHEGELLEKLEHIMTKSSFLQTKATQEFVQKYDWKNLIREYDEMVSTMKPDAS